MNGSFFDQYYESIRNSFSLFFESRGYGPDRIQCLPCHRKRGSKHVRNGLSCSGINPANLGWRSYEDKKVTLGTTETSFSLYSDVLSKQALRASIKNAIQTKVLIALAEKKALDMQRTLQVLIFILILTIIFSELRIRERCLEDWPFQ